MNLKIQLIKTLPASTNSNSWRSHATPEHKPTLVMVADRWDDFGAETQFDVFLYLQDKSEYIGKTKVIHRSEDSGDGQYYYTKHLMEDEYDGDLTDCCSLGQYEQFYIRLIDYLGNDALNLFKRLHDCGVNSAYEDEFESHRWFYSLTREDSAERMLRETQYIVNGVNPEENYTFDYFFKPKYAEDATSVRFSFQRDKDLPIPRRIFALIGKNGVGKTQLITKLPIDIAEKKSACFGGKVPIFSKILAASTCYYDNFKSPQEGANTNYVYCGLSKELNGNRQTLSKQEVHRNLIEALKKISEKNRREDYEKRIVKLLDYNRSAIEIASIYSTFEDERGNTRYRLNAFKTIRMFDRLSSGERIMVYLWSQLVANIRYDTLVLFDEPETHLHPNAISELIVHLSSLLKKYESYAIIVTHSPLVIRELKSECVFVMDRVENELVTRKVEYETFGSNLSTLVDDIFGNSESVKLFETFIKRQIRRDKSADEIENMIKSEGVPLSLRLRMMIRTLCLLKDHEED